MKRFFYMSALSTLLLSAGGCSGSDAPDELSVPGSVTLLTRGGDGAATAYRLLVFNEDGNACLKNIPFASNGGKVELATGSYQFVTLTEAAGLELPAAGTVEGLTLTTPIGLQADVALQPFRISAVGNVTIPDNTVYDAKLNPATCGLVLNVVGEEAKKMTFHLKNMYAGICPDKSHLATQTVYPLQSGTNTCLPTNGNAVLVYQSGVGAQSELSLDIPFEAGFTYTVDLAYSEGVLSFKTTVTDWTSGGNPVTGSAEILLGSGITTQVQTATDVPDKQIASGQEVGIFINEDVASGTVIGTNLKYEADGNGGLTLATMEPEQKIPYYPTSGNGVNIIAYQPYDASAAIVGGTNTYNFSVKTDQNGNSNKDYYDSDLLYSSSETYTPKADAQSLVFKHVLSKVVCTLAKGTGSPDLTGATVEIVGAGTKGSFKLSDGSFTTNTNDSDSKRNIKMNSTITPSSFIAVIPPQTFAKGAQFLKVTLSTSAGGGVFYYKIPDDSGLALTGGSVYKYEIKVNMTGLTVTSSIKDWTVVGSYPIAGDAEMGS